MTAKIKAAAIRENQSANEEIFKIVNDEKMSKSAKIRTLHSMGVERGVIAQLLGIKYQHVRNVLVTQLTGKPKKEEPQVEEQPTE